MTNIIINIVGLTAILGVGLLMASFGKLSVKTMEKTKEIDRLKAYIYELQQTEKELMKMNENLQTKLYKK